MRTIRALAKKIAIDFKPEKIILFGSYAYGKPHEWSDVDLMVLMRSDKREHKQAVEIALALNYWRGLDLIVRSPEEFDRRVKLGDFFLRDIATRGKVLYERVDG